jgi:hypothetical protein
LLEVVFMRTFCAALLSRIVFRKPVETVGETTVATVA